jgi:hypothetical protein
MTVYAHAREVLPAVMLFKRYLVAMASGYAISTQDEFGEFELPHSSMFTQLLQHANLCISRCVGPHYSALYRTISCTGHSLIDGSCAPFSRTVFITHTQHALLPDYAINDSTKNVAIIEHAFA